jgi:membrane carboxypeptidase/penicillin-binding protein PbpC
MGEKIDKKLEKFFNSTFFRKKILPIFLILLFFYIVSCILNNQLEEAYKKQFSISITDRNGDNIYRAPNDKSHYATKLDNIPQRIEDLLIKKEDKYFYWHFGLNPISTTRGILGLVTQNKTGGSTISQQLAKILLNNENTRTLVIKIKEILYTLSLEIHHSKKEILNMYANCIYFGNQAEGVEEASHLYFNKNAENLSDVEILKLLATISNPTNQNPWTKNNSSVTKSLAKKLKLEIEIPEKASDKIPYRYQGPALFEMQTLGIACESTCQTSIDQKLTEKLREILKRNILYTYNKGARNGAIVILKEPENEILAIVGSPNPEAEKDGSKINMAIRARPIGSTVKPLIYTKGFEKGLRPYSKVDDREYQYGMGTGFLIYPKNYDGEYRGIVTLHEALSNSLNVPSVKVLEYVGLDNFYSFLEQKLKFIPIQDLENYQYGIALGGLETDLLTLSHFFSIFTNKGIIYPLKIFVGKTNNQNFFIPPHNKINATEKIFEPQYVQLTNKILNDRSTGANQFGMKSNLNLTENNYAVKTGTSRDYHDSWVIGYTPDFIVGVWLGNSENTPLQQLSGQSGAGKIWHEVMELMFTTEYNKKNNFSFEDIANFKNNGSIEYGLTNDKYDDHVSLLLEKNLILSPHEKDIFELSPNFSIPLESRESVTWFANGIEIGKGKKIKFQPNTNDNFEIEALTENNESAFVKISVTKKE